MLLEAGLSLMTWLSFFIHLSLSLLALFLIDMVHVVLSVDVLYL